MTHSLFVESSMPVEHDKTIEVDTNLGKEEIHVIRQGCGNAHFVVWHGFDSVNRFYPWDHLLHHGSVSRAGLPGHGPVRQRSWSHCKRWSQAHFVEAGVALCRKLYDGRPLTLVGHSTGALVALGVAIHAPEIVARTVLVSPLIWSSKNQFTQFLVASKLWPILGRIAMGKAFRKKQSSIEYYYEAIDEIVRDHQSIYVNPSIRPALFAGQADYRRISINTHLGAARAAVTGDFRRVIRDAHCKVPSLIVHGTEDPVAPPGQSEWLVQNMENAQLIKRPGIGHVAYVEREQEFIAMLDDWLNTH